MKYYTFTTHSLLYKVSVYVRNTIEAEKEINTIIVSGNAIGIE